MFNKSELDLVIDTFRKCGIPISVISVDASLAEVLDSAGAGEGGGFRSEHSIANVFGEPVEGQVYRVQDCFGFKGIYFLLPIAKNERLVFIGPYTSSDKTEAELMSELETGGINLKNRQYLVKYCASIPVIAENSAVFVLLNAFLSRLFQRDDYKTVDIELNKTNYTMLDGMKLSEDLDSSLLHMKLIERRYKYENDIIQAVATGQIQRVNEIISAFSQGKFEMRSPDPLRNMKNYCIIMNTILRKAAERGGVHPVYLDKTSTDFAIKIEKQPSTDACSMLMKDMYEAYCRLVRKHTLKGYSQIVQKTVSVIDIDLSADLSPSRLAKIAGVSLPYLSTAFRREVGRTLGEYIRDKRMKYACHLLSESDLQVQTVAIHVGIEDAQYFSRMFKKYTGKTPLEYRENS